MRLASVFAALLLGACILSPLVSHVALAAETSVGAAVGGPLKQAQELAKANKFADALKKAKEADAVARKTSYESFAVDEVLTYLYVKLKDYGSAAQSAEASLASGQVPAKDRPQRLKTLVQLNYSVKNYEKTIAFAKQYQDATGPDAGMQQLVVQSYYLQKNYPNTQSAAKALVASAKAAGHKPDETILQLWLASAFQQKDRKGQREALMALVESYPSPTYMSDLINLVEADLGKSDRMSFEVLRLKLAAGALKSSDDYVEMAQLAIQLGLPGEAESVMEKGFAAGILGGKNKSREQRLQTMAKQQATQDEPTLGQAAGTPKAKAALAEAYASYGKTDKAIALYREALVSAFPEADLARLHLGQAYRAKGDAASARAAFIAIKDARLSQLGWIWVAVSR